MSTIINSTIRSFDNLTRETDRLNLTDKIEVVVQDTIKLLDIWTRRNELDEMLECQPELELRIILAQLLIDIYHVQTHVIEEDPARARLEQLIDQASQSLKEIIV